MARKLSLALFVLLLSAFFAACNKTAAPAAVPEAVPESVVETVAAGDRMTVIAYQTKIRDLFQQINDISAGADMETADGVKKLIDQILPLYSEINNLVPPEKLTDADKTLKDGCNKNLEALQLSKEILSVGANPTADDLQKVTQLQKLMDEMSTIQASMDAALADIYKATSD